MLYSGTVVEFVFAVFAPETSIGRGWSSGRGCGARRSRERAHEKGNEVALVGRVADQLHGSVTNL